MHKPFYFMYPDPPPGGGTPPPADPPPADPPADPPSDPPADPPADPPQDPPQDPPPQDPPQDPPEPKVLQPGEYKLPKGVPEDLGQFAHDNGMTQEQLDATVSRMTNFVTQRSQAEKQQMKREGQEHVKKWGENAQHNVRLVGRALQVCDTSGSLSKLLDQTGYGDHPAVLDFLYNIGKSLQEGGFLKSFSGRTPGKKSAAQVLYPNHPSKPTY
jgi:hypothetical protein